jgi:hypothetical protein
MKDALSTGPLSAPECGHCKFAMVDGFERLEERWLGMMGKSSVKVWAEKEEYWVGWGILNEEELP